MHSFKKSHVKLFAIAALTLNFSCGTLVANAENGANENSLPVFPSKWLERADLSDGDKERVQNVTKPTDDFSTSEKFELMQGGAGTSKKLPDHDAFSHFPSNISFADEERFKLGNALFRKLWVSSPSSTQASDGLGPLFNARSCQSCHIKDGRGHPPFGQDGSSSMFLRLARPALTDEEHRALENYTRQVLPDPTYGEQLQDFAVPGFSGEGQMVITYEELPVTLSDGTIVNLRKPHYSIDNLSHGPLGPDTSLSPRVANPMIGLGLVEAIHPADIIAHSDPDDSNGDGISGRPALVRDGKTGELQLGRFGWKAQNSSIRAQSAGALAGDIGVSSPDVPKHYGDCTQAQQDCLALPNGVQSRLGKTEAPDPVMDLITFYSQNLAVPARRNLDDPTVLRGKALFYQLGCALCHTPKYVTSREAELNSHRFQLIWPYSDFLLHDMGDGLADGQNVGVANGNEWRTPPLWGIGLTKTVNDHTLFLHDGRARDLNEAILWHGGEAEKAREGYSNLAKDDRDALIQFLESM